MKTYLDCVACKIRQASEAIQLATEDPLRQEEAMKKVLQAISTMPFTKTPVAMRRDVHGVVKDILGNENPYASLKSLSNEIGAKLYPKLKEIVRQSQKPLLTAIRLAVAGNIIDFGALNPNEVSEERVQNTITNVLNTTPVIDDSMSFASAVETASNIWYIADNCGELFFDRVLIEELPIHKVTCVVRGYPILNDATYEDAKETGLTEIVSVIDDGCDAPALILEECTASFRESFHRADLVVVKGQGNYEAMNSLDKEMYFLLMVKCDVVARDIGCRVGDIVIKAVKEIVHA